MTNGVNKLTNLNEHIEQIVTLQENLRDENLSLVDFDQLEETLREQLLKLEQLSQLSDEVQILREDYESRIGGMAKAIAVADRTNGAMSRSAEIVSSLPTLSGADLVNCYHQIAARFRDMFPASYTRLAANSTGGRVMKNPGQYK